MTAQVVLALAVFGACAVEAVEALTLVVAAGTTRGWHSAFEGTAVALVVLAVLIGAVGVPLVHYVPIDVLRVVVGGLLLVLGLSWLRKAILRSSGHVAMHDEDAIYARTIARLSDGTAVRSGYDGLGFVVAFKGVLLEGLEIVLIVISLGSSSHHLGLAAAMAGAAVVVVSGVGVLVSRQLREVPENTLKFGVGIMLSSFGVFWVGEGVGLSWPGSDAMILALIAGFLLFSHVLVRFMRAQLGGASQAGRGVRVGET
ncbi:MAG: hypothetical protein WCF24_08835 [Acidimicrobiales bacterium]